MSSGTKASTSSSTFFLVTTSVFTTALFSYYVHRITLRRKISQWEEKRAAERKGRIRAEVKLRNTLKQQERKDNDTTTADHSMTLKQIGTVISPFVKRMGTPRQGALVPSGRGYVEFSPVVQPSALEGLEAYSHVWILFEFHANTDIATESRKSKIKPPRAPSRVGMLASRSPHRPNAIGLSLVKFEKLRGRRLYISALDLVHGTPVYDIKPCVPWDIPGCGGGSGSRSNGRIVVPDWVSQDDALSQVVFSPRATDSLRELMTAAQSISPAYESNHVELVKNAIQEVLAQDPRAGHKRGTVTTKADKPYTIMFGSAQVEFVVDGTGLVKVVGIHQVDYPESSYVDGIPLASEAL